MAVTPTGIARKAVLKRRRSGPSPTPKEPSEKTGGNTDLTAPVRQAANQVPADAAGIIVLTLAWIWVVLPAIDGGPSRVKQVLLAKFLNKGPDGKELP